MMSPGPSCRRMPVTVAGGSRSSKGESSIAVEVQGIQGPPTVVALRRVGGANGAYRHIIDYPNRIADLAVGILDAVYACTGG